MKDKKLSLKNEDNNKLLSDLHKIGINEDYDISQLHDLLDEFELNELTQDSKKDYYILQHSFILTHDKSNSLYMCNRDPIAFDGKSERVTKGLSILLSASNTNKNPDNFKFITDTIKNKIFFKKDIINVEIKFLGFGYNNIRNKANYIFMVYQVNITDTDAVDALLFNVKKKEENETESFIDLDYIFKIDKDFLNSEAGQSFINKNAHFDNSVIRSFGNVNTHVFEYENAYFFKASNTFSQEIGINYIDKKEKFRDFLMTIVNQAKKDKSFFLEEAANLLMSEDKAEAMYEILKCMYKVPIGIIKLS